ncbi:coiled-coil and C2 domain-containing protein 2A isoform X2 [Toxorhynchites rutilus septentrionalis]|uniref:coiled-coil and C2 domain-containing protein 2A isoform X2 n=1 Tax=Toxorhynchites rutilus septentrionalis TaxID=329112 RepID=UPI002479247C|nr:coiled-coil and C2 domain-containing protein 2A isoform X2 [Toxorhynchites rutilus septentrionalis]
MSDPKPKSPRKRRSRGRHRKRQVVRAQTTKHVQPNIAPVAEEIQLGTTRKLKLQLDPEYIREEQEVKSSLEKLRSDLGSDQLHSTDREVLFFVDSLPEMFYDAQDQLDGEAEGRTEHEQVLPEKSPSIRSVSNTQDSPTHLASSYIQPDEDQVIQRCQLKKLVLNDDLLFVPSKSLAEVRSFLEQVTVGSDDGSKSVEEALVKPILNSANKSRLINRLIEEEQEEWFDASGDLVNLQSFIVDKRMRSVCGKKFVPYFVEPLPMTQTAEQLPAERTVKVLIGKLRFENHPTFDEAMKLRLKLKQIYKLYYTNRKLKVVSGLQKKLDDLRCMTNESDEYGLSFKMQRRELRKLVYKEAKSERQMEKQILDLWKELKGIKVIIANDEFGQNEAKVSWNKRFNAELEEVIDEEQELYIKEKQKYKAYLRDLEVNINAGEVIPIQKPKKPDISRLNLEFKKIFSESFRSPGEPMIDIFLREEPIQTFQPNSNNDLRYKVKFYLDDKHLASTKPREFQSDSLVDFNTSFSVKLTTKIPETMKIELYEKNRLKHKMKLAEIFIPLPNSDEIFDEVEYVHYEFSSGKPYKLNEYHNGKIDLKVGWLEQAELNFPSLPKKRNIPKRVHLSKELLKKWFDDQLLDPNDSDAEILMKALESTDKDSGDEQGNLQEDDDTFVFNEDLLAFCSDEEINNNERLNMLFQRFNCNMRYKNIKFIPQSEREIEIPNEKKIIDETLGTDPIDLQRHYGKKYLKKVYGTIANHCSVINQDKIDDNLLIGDQVPTMESLRVAFSKLFGPRRPLKPSRKSPLSRASIKVTDVSNLKIVVTVVRAFGIPMRSDDHQVASPGERRNSGLSSTKFSFRASNVRPYITISIKDKILRTSTADGTNPTWNEQLTIPLDGTSDQIRKFLNIDLYDELTEDLLEDDRARTTEVYQRISSKWLGQLRIPISTIYLNHRIEGTFELSTPPILFGYTQCSSEAPEYTSMFIGTSLPDMREASQISLFVSLEPNVEVPSLDTNGLECVEFEQTKTHIYLWFEEYRNEFPLRAKMPLVTLLSGKRVSITRLLGPIDVPFVVDENVEPMIRRYVSLIPIHYNTDACSQLDGVWLTNKEILSMMCASPKDLGVLLTCFYTALEYDAYLLIGHSLLNGDSTFVLLREGNEFLIVDPTSGKKYNSTDTYCPLNRVYSIVNEDNLWANIQKENRVFLTQLDVSKSAYWRPLFTRTHEAPTGCVHDGKYLYRNALSVRDLQKTIERKIFKKIAAWRTHRKTIWNRYISEQLKYVLSSLETDVSLEVSTDRHTEMFNRLFISHKINGFPLNFPYTNLSNAVAQVKATGIHLNSENNVEFALGVYIKDYPSNIYSVWIFLVSLVPKI